CLAVAHLVYLTLFVGLKSPCYLVFILPFYAASWAVGIWKLHLRKSIVTPISVVAAILFVACQVNVEIYKIHDDSYRTEYLPTVQFVKARLDDVGGIAAGHAYFGFNLGFERLRDDIRLGFY